MLLPSEEILWEGRPTPAPRSRAWLAAAWGAALLASISGLFCAVLWASDLPGAVQMGLVTSYLTLGAVGVIAAPSYLIDRCRYTITSRRVLWQRGRMRRSIDRTALTFARIHWHPSRTGVGDLELVRAVPFGPFARGQRLMLHAIASPGTVLAIVRGVPAIARLGDGDLSLTDRLDEGEQVLWDGAPQGWLLGWRDVVTALGGLAVIGVGIYYWDHATAILRMVFGLGLSGLAWSLLAIAMLLTATLVFAVGSGLLWHGFWRARAMGRETEYVLTDRRVLIRRGRTELSLDRRRIVDVAQAPSLGGVSHLYLILDAPEARALADSGALGVLAPSRDAVPPVLYELRDPQGVIALLLHRISTPQAA